MVTKEELLPYVHDMKAGIAHFGVSRRTLTRWLQHHDIYDPKPNYGPKLSSDDATEIRRLFESGTPQKELAKIYGVTVATIGRIINNVHHRVSKDTAIVSIIYNPRSQ
jgi:hypothetical protein